MSGTRWLGSERERLLTTIVSKTGALQHESSSINVTFVHPSPYRMVSVDCAKRAMCCRSGRCASKEVSQHLALVCHEFGLLRLKVRV